jgi:hypothetical protein
MKTSVRVSLPGLALTAVAALSGCGDANPNTRPARDPGAPDPSVAAYQQILAARMRDGTAAHELLQVRPSPMCIVEGVPHQVDVMGGCPGQVLPQHASKLPRCPVNQIKVRARLLGREHNPTDAMFAEGCGQRAIYVERPWSTPREWYVVARFALGGDAQ